MNPFQAVYNWIDRQRTPKWLRDLFSEVEYIIYTSLCTITKETLAKIEAKIIEVNSLQVSNKEKFRLVWEFCKIIGIVTSETIGAIIINALVLKLKERKAI